MKKLLPFLFLLLNACQGQLTPVSIQTAAQAYVQPPLQPTTSLRVYTETSQPIEKEVIVKYRPGFRVQAAPLGAEILDAFNTAEETTQLHRLSGKVSMEQALRQYQADPAVEFAIPNIRFQVQMSLLERVKKFFGKKPTSPETIQPSANASPAAAAEPLVIQDPLAHQQWYLQDLNLPQVWANRGLGNATVTVAVLDTGVDDAHPDLQGKVIKGADYIDKDFEPKDQHGHGTHVAGIVAAQLNNHEGITGLAPQVRILAVRVLDEQGSGSLFNIAKGIAYAANQGAKVINLSLGSPPGGAVMRTLANFIASYAERKGALIVAAAGNDGGAVGYPAAASKFLCVGAVNQQKALASFSNRGPELDVVAPGVGILSTFPTYEVTANRLGLPRYYASLNGTSMATPMVSALAALIWSQQPSLSPAEVRSRIEKSTQDLGAVGRDSTFGLGLINFEAALQD